MLHPKRGACSIAFAGALVTVSAAAHAAPTTSATASDDADTVAPHAVDVVASGAVTAIGADLTLAGYWRTSPRVALGVVTAVSVLGQSHNASFAGRFNEEQTVFYRTAPAVRWDFHFSRTNRVWLGAEAGLLLNLETGTGPGPDRRTRAIPGMSMGAEFGAAANADPFSIGAVVRGLYAPVVREDSLRLEGVFVGFVVGLHVPVGAPVAR